jgi:dTDP-4-amino-4,6-dideoxygalactose transaminase
LKNMDIPFALPECGKEEVRAIAEVIKSGWLTTGSRTFQFEREFAEHIGAKYCLAVNSGTAALHLGLEALGIRPVDKVVVPVYTFTATAEVARYLGADPLFVDCDPETFCVTPREIENVIQKYTSELADPNSEFSIKAVIPMHFGGHPCDMEGIMALAHRRGLKVLEDAAHAFPTFCAFSGPESQRKDRKMIGTIGDVTCFSFYANKTITTGEGGMLATDDEEIVKRLKVMRLHGIDRDIWNRFSDLNVDWAYDVVAPGFKYNMPDLAAALGIHQLRKAAQFREKRQRIAQMYFQELAGIPGLILPRIKCAMEDHSWHLFVVLIEPEETVSGLNRDQFIQEMKEKGIGTGVHYIPLHRMTYYQQTYRLRPDMFPNSEWVFRRCVSLPIYSAMSDVQLSYVIDSIREIMK